MTVVLLKISQDYRLTYLQDECYAIFVLRLCEIQNETSSAKKLQDFFKIFLGDTCPFMGPLISQFWTSGDVSSGLQSHGQRYSHLAEGCARLSVKVKVVLFDL